ncbi:hypothetical protein QVD17_19896 [Tagetes erecta]|uniref:Uncharacterized protein n=1 Tax=Tagetes erecta TaxID=13708 RepID=A0AAD8NXM3_TARER|nr:hypothetical protein QVD17_19896 [Tagetes erecta]
MGRTPESSKNDGLRKGPWSTEEDQKLIDYIQKNGYGKWRTLPKDAGLKRCGKSCRLRWTNYLRPDIKRGKFSFEEEATIIQLHGILGNKWSTIATHLPGRTDNEIKNYWNTHIRKKLIQMGIDPVTHKPRLDLSSILSLSGIQPIVDLELLQLAATFLATQGIQNVEFSYPNTTPQNHLENTLQLQENNHLTQDQTLIQEMIPNYSALTTLSCGVPYASESSSKFMEDNVDRNISDLRPNSCQTSVTNLFTLDDCHRIDPQSNFSNEVGLMPSFLPSSTCTPSSSRNHVNSNSNSTYINENAVEEDKEISYCSNMFKYEFQEVLNNNILM